MVPRTSTPQASPYLTSSHARPKYLVRTESRWSARSDNGYADDERSSSSSTEYTDSLTSEMGEPLPAYPGEDTRPTSRKELAGFYAYSFAAEVFVVCGLGAFIPITLEELARASSSAVLASDHSKPCRAHGIDVRGPGAKQCVFHILGSEINTASFAMYTFSISVLLQAMIVVTISGAADHGRYRKQLLVGFAVTGAVATMLFLPITPDIYLLGSLWAMIGNVCFGASFVLLNSFLPVLVRHFPPSTSEGRANGPIHLPNDHDQSNSDLPSSPGIDDTTAALLPGEETTPYSASFTTGSPDPRLSTRISSYGVGIGYIACVVVQAFSIFILKSTGSNLWSLRLVLFFIGLWWLSFTLPAALWLRPRPGPPLTKAENGGARSWVGYLTYSWVNLGRTLMRARKLKDVLLFLAAWFMISDGIATVSGTAILFAKTTLGMDSSALALINVIVTLSGILGAFTWSKFSALMGLKPSHTILVCICLFELIPLYGLLGYISSSPIGLKQQWEMYPLGAVYGLVLGGLSSYCRALFGDLIPPGSEAAFYALYAITDKGSSVFGPAIVGAITDATGDIRPAFWFLAALVGVPIPIMWCVDVERGRRAAWALAEETVGLAGIEDDEEEEEEEEREAGR